MLLCVTALMVECEARAQTDGSIAEPTLCEFRSPYAGKVESRIGGSVESERNKLRLDIGGSVNLATWEKESYDDPFPGARPTTDQRITLGADFFTWTRLRSTSSFKFPVEAIDYYFGLQGTWSEYWDSKSDIHIRLRAAHISAHLVDGDPSFTDPEQEYITYSREFVDFLAGFRAPVYFARCIGRGYFGAVWLFHTIPDTLGVVTPYAGFDFDWQPAASFPATVRFGYEVRLNTELEPIGEHLLRLGLKFARPFSNGVIIEGSYYSGRSPYGQHFSQREKVFSLGFAIDF